MQNRKSWPSYVLWLVGTSRNALVVLLASAMAYILKRHGHTPFTLLGPVPSGFPTPTEPGVNYDRLQACHSGFVVCLSAVQRLAASAVTVALVGYLESISMAKAFARKNGYEAGCPARICC